MATNQGESSTQDNQVKRPTQMGVPENLGGVESGESPQGEWGAASGIHPIDAGSPAQINITASTENQSAKFKNPQAKQDATGDELPITG